MKVLNLLKEKTGKLVLGASQAAGISVAVGILATTMMYNTASHQVEEEAIRSLSSVSSASAYEGLNRRADGMLSSMNIQNREGSKGVAVGADRERLEGTRSKNDFGLSAIDNLENNISLSGVGSAAATSATDGLGSGGVDMVEVGGGRSSSRAAVPGVSASSVGQGASGVPAGGTTSSGTHLASASMARASGNAFNAASGSMGGGSVGGAAGGRGGASGSRSSGSDGYQFSGAMPSGSNVVSAQSAALAGGRTSGSGFIAGGRGSTAGKGSRSLRDKNNDLKDISKRSADAAKNSHRSANEGSRAFLASSQNSGGMSIDGAGETVSTGSADFSTPEASNLKAIGNWGEQQDDYGDRKEKARKQLAWMWLGTLGGGIALLFAAAYALSAIPAGPWKIAAQVAFMAAIIAPCAILIKKALDYQHEFNGTMMSVISCLTATALIAGMMFTVLKPDVAKTWLKTHFIKILIGFGTSVGLGLISSTMMSSL